MPSIGEGTESATGDRCDCTRTTTDRRRGCNAIGDAPPLLAPWIHSTEERLSTDMRDDHTGVKFVTKASWFLCKTRDVIR